MAADPQVDLIFQHFTPRYVETGVNMSDLLRLRARIQHWADWCRMWSEMAACHEALAMEALEKHRDVTAGQAFLRASICYHYAKHLFCIDPAQYAVAHANMLRCYTKASTLVSPNMERVAFPYQGSHLVGWLRKPAGATRPAVAVILPGLDACKEELHEWSDAFLERGLATLTLDGPGQGETAALLPITTEWGKVLGAVIDVLERRDDVDGHNVAVIGQSFGALYAPLSAAFEPRIRACVSNCGPFNMGAVLPQMPAVSQEMFRVRSHSPDAASALALAHRLSLGNGVAERISCPLLVVFGAGDKIIPASEGARLAKAASGKVDYVVYEEGNHVCFNIPYKFRPLTADWTAEQLSAPD